MKKLKIELENCYGIKKFSENFDFTNSRVIEIYAPNGSMKTSFAKTFSDIVAENETKDCFYPSRTCKRQITDENGIDLRGENIFVIPNYDEYFETDKISTLLASFSR